MSVTFYEGRKAPTDERRQALTLAAASRIVNECTTIKPDMHDDVRNFLVGAIDYLIDARARKLRTEREELHVLERAESRSLLEVPAGSDLDHAIFTILLGLGREAPKSITTPLEGGGMHQITALPLQLSGSKTPLNVEVLRIHDTDSAAVEYLVHDAYAAPEQY